MPTIIDYPLVLERLTAQGMVCTYHNAGAFAFPRQSQVKTVGWIGAPDPTIRPAALPFIHSVEAPYETTLARLAASFWLQQLGGEAWVMPMSHWAYELEFGSREWMPELLREIGLDPLELAPRNNGSAIAFAAAERGPYHGFLQGLLANLSLSDFTLAFPGRAVLCSVHHHRQLWWTTTDEAIHTGLELMARSGRVAPPN